MQIRFVESSNHFYHILVSSGPKGKKTFMQIHIPDIDIDIGLMSNWCEHAWLKLQNILWACYKLQSICRSYIVAHIFQYGLQIDLQPAHIHPHDMKSFSLPFFSVSNFKANVFYTTSVHILSMVR